MTDHMADREGNMNLPQGSFEEFQADWRTWQGRLRRYAARRLAYHEVPSGWLDADDVVQLTWLVLHSNQAKVRRPDRYMYRVAGRLIERAGREVFRSEGHYAQFWHDPNPWWPHGTSLYLSAEQAVIDRETATELAAAREDLTDHQRVVVRGLIDEELPYQQIADILGISVGAVSAYRARALAKLRTIIYLPGSGVGVEYGYLYTATRYTPSPEAYSRYMASRYAPSRYPAWRRTILVPVVALLLVIGAGVLAVAFGALRVLAGAAALAGLGLAVAAARWVATAAARGVRARQRRRAPDGDELRWKPDKD
jgi:RNA polymerase sigma factor (sigma-70 family)